MENLLLTMGAITMSDVTAYLDILHTVFVFCWYFFLSALAISSPFLILWVIGKIGLLILEKVAKLVFMAIFYVFGLIFAYVLKPIYYFVSYRILDPIQLFISDVLDAINPIKFIKRKRNERYRKEHPIQTTVMYR